MPKKTDFCAELKPGTRAELKPAGTAVSQRWRRRRRARQCWLDAAAAGHARRLARWMARHSALHALRRAAAPPANVHTHAHGALQFVRLSLTSQPARVSAAPPGTQVTCGPREAVERLSLPGRPGRDAPTPSFSFLGVHSMRMYTCTRARGLVHHVELF
eukprot:31725-Prymnesium_polylepis.1